MLSNDIIPFDENGNPLKNIYKKGDKIPDNNPNSMNDIVPLLHCHLNDLTSTPTIDLALFFRMLIIKPVPHPRSNALSKFIS